MKLLLHTYHSYAPKQSRPTDLRIIEEGLELTPTSVVPAKSVHTVVFDSRFNNELCTRPSGPRIITSTILLQHCLSVHASLPPNPCFICPRRRLCSLQWCSVQHLSRPLLSVLLLRSCPGWRKSQFHPPSNLLSGGINPRWPLHLLSPSDGRWRWDQ